jgi:hypothetical protein
VDLIFIAGQYPISTIIQPFLPLQSVEVPPASFQLGYDISVQTVHVVVTKRIILKCNEPYDRAMQRNATQCKAKQATAMVEALVTPGVFSLSFSTFTLSTATTFQGRQTSRGLYIDMSCRNKTISSDTD